MLIYINFDGLTMEMTGIKVLAKCESRLPFTQAWHMMKA